MKVSGARKKNGVLLPSFECVVRVCLGSCCGILVTLDDNELHFAVFSSEARLMRESVDNC